MNNSAVIVAIFGAFFAVVAGIASFADRKRQNRKNIESVGFMPWTAIFMWSLLIAVVLLGMAMNSYRGN